MRRGGYAAATESDQQRRFAETVEQKKAEAKEASEAPHEEHGADGKVAGEQRSATDADHDGVRPAGRKGGGSANRWDG